jgi:dTDP-4-amino-4,6-dideoxygalactose transaminase
MKTEVFPRREAFGSDEFFSLMKVAFYYRFKGEDPPYRGRFQSKFEEEFSTLFGGRSLLVSSGTSALYVALSSLNPGNREKDVILVSGITDGGCISAIIQSGYKPILIDTGNLTFNVDLNEIKSLYEKLPRETRTRIQALLVCHIGGEPVRNMTGITEWCNIHGIDLIEDCSQAIGAVDSGGVVGSFGKLAAFSIMYRKNVSSGGSGGVVTINDESLADKVFANSDRGKQIWRGDINQNDPGNSLFPALNHNSNEFTAAIATASLRRLDKTNRKRRAFCTDLLLAFKHKNVPLRNERFNNDWAPFYLTLYKDSKSEFDVKDLASTMMGKFGVPLLVNYGCLVSKWDWAKKYLAYETKLRNAEKNIQSSFNLFLNEKYSRRQIEQIVRTCQNYFESL